MMLDTVAMIAALGLMTADIVAKILTSRLLFRLQGSIEQANQELQKVRRELGMIRAQKETAHRNKELLERKKDKVQKRISRLRSELKALREEEVRRRELRDAVRGIVAEPAEDLFAAADELSEE